MEVKPTRRRSPRRQPNQQEEKEEKEKKEKKEDPVEVEQALSESPVSPSIDQSPAESPPQEELISEEEVSPDKEANRPTPNPMELQQEVSPPHGSSASGVGMEGDEEEEENQVLVRHNEMMKLLLDMKRSADRVAKRVEILEKGTPMKKNHNEEKFTSKEREEKHFLPSRSYSQSNVEI